MPSDPPGELPSNLYSVLSTSQSPTSSEAAQTTAAPSSTLSTSAPAADSSVDQSAANAYWSSIPSTVNGMLGGFPQISRIDLQGSANFLTKLRRLHPSSDTTTTTTDTPPTDPATGKPFPFRRALDCGAGIGRITQGLLVHQAAVVDIVEPIAKFTDAFAASPEGRQLLDSGRVGRIHNQPLQDFRFPTASADEPAYDLIWNQWCLPHLTDAQLAAYLSRAAAALLAAATPHAYLVVKENLSSDPHGEDLYDDLDSSVTRSEPKYLQLFAQAGLRVVYTELQRGFPRGIFPVRMWALRPVEGAHASSSVEA